MIFDDMDSTVFFDFGETPAVSQSLFATYGEQVGQGGRFFVGLGVSFLRFEKTMQKITMRTGDSEAETASGATLKSIDAYLRWLAHYTRTLCAVQVQDCPS